MLPQVCSACRLSSTGLLPVYSICANFTEIDAPKAIGLDVEFCVNHRPAAIDAKLIQIGIERAELLVPKKNTRPPCNVFAYQSSDDSPLQLKGRFHGLDPTPHTMRLPLPPV